MPGEAVRPACRPPSTDRVGTGQPVNEVAPDSLHDPLESDPCRKRNPLVIRKHTGLGALELGGVLLKGIMETVRGNRLVSFPRYVKGTSM